MVLCWFEIELGVVWGVLGWFGAVWGGLGRFGVVWGHSMDPPPPRTPPLARSESVTYKNEPPTQTDNKYPAEVFLADLPYLFM